MELLASVIDQNLEEVHADIQIAQRLLRSAVIQSQLQIVFGMELNAQAEGLVLALHSLDDVNAVNGGLGNYGVTGIPLILSIYEKSDGLESTSLPSLVS